MATPNCLRDLRDVSFDVSLDAWLDGRLDVCVSVRLDAWVDERADVRVDAVVEVVHGVDLGLGLQSSGVWKLLVIA